MQVNPFEGLGRAVRREKLQDALHQFYVAGKRALRFPFGLPCVSCVHRKALSHFGSHSTDRLQNYTIIFQNYSISLAFRMDIMKLVNTTSGTYPCSRCTAWASRYKEQT